MLVNTETMPNLRYNFFVLLKSKLNSQILVEVKACQHFRLYTTVLVWNLGNDCYRSWETLNLHVLKSKLAVFYHKFQFFKCAFHSFFCVHIIYCQDALWDCWCSPKQYTLGSFQLWTAIYKRAFPDSLPNEKKKLILKHLRHQHLWCKRNIFLYVDTKSPSYSNSRPRRVPLEIKINLSNFHLNHILWYPVV